MFFYRASMGATPLRYPFVRAKAEGAEPSGSLAVTVVFAVVENVKVKFVGESLCEQFFVLMNTSVLSL